MTLEESIHNIDIRDILREQGVSELHPIQRQAISAGLFFHQNLFIATPSGSGKTLIAELAVYHTLLGAIGKALYLVPFKALATEKYLDFQKILGPYGFKVELATSDEEIVLQNPKKEENIVNPTDWDLLITTYEKGDVLLRNFPPLKDQIRCIVVDEIHELSTPERGVRLELLLMCLLLYTPGVQIIALSATVRNFTEIAGWLTHLNPTFKIIHSDVRPVPLKYRIEVSPNRITTIKQICVQVIAEHGSVLVFVNRRVDTIAYAEQIAPLIASKLSAADRKKLRQAMRGFANAKLAGLIRHGVGFHNASLIAEERRVLEGLFRQRLVKVLVATTTLAAGVNTPARCVIVASMVHTHNYKIKDPTQIVQGTVHRLGEQWITPLNANLFFQMVGRAGRFGFDIHGEGILLCGSEAERNLARYLYFDRSSATLYPKYDDIMSQLMQAAAIEDALIYAVQLHQPCLPTHIENFFRQSLYVYQMKSQNFPTDQMLIRFGILTPDLASLVKIHGKTQKEEVICRLEDQTPDMIKGRISVNGQIYFLSLSLTGLYCSCTAQNQIRHTVGLWMKGHFCLHLTHFLEFLLHQSEAIQNLSENLILQCIPQEFLLPYYFRYGVLTQHPRTHHITLTSFGRLIYALYARPTRMITFRNLISNHECIDLTFLLRHLCEIYRKDRGYLKTDPYPLLMDWIEEYTMEHLLHDRPSVGFADVLQIKNEISRSLDQCEAIALHIGKEPLAARIKQYRLRVQYGVKSDLIDLMETLQPNITRNKARLLYNAGYTLGEQVLQTPLYITAKAAGIPMRTMIDLVRREPKVPLDAIPKEASVPPKKAIRSRSLPQFW
jgi:replicative superfamily II helicase